MKIPDWAPSEVIELLRQEQLEAEEDINEWGVASESTLKSIGFFEQILTNSKMRDVWERIQEFPKPNNRQASNAQLFARAAHIAFMGNVSPSQKLTPKQRNKFIKDTQSITNDLINQIKGTELDQFHLYEHWNKKTKEIVANTGMLCRKEEGKFYECPSCKRYMDKIERWGRTDFTETLTAFLESIPELINKDIITKEKRIFLAKPRDKKYSKRGYFARELTAQCKELFGCTYRSIVKTTINVVYPDTSIRKRVLTRLAPDTKPDS